MRSLIEKLTAISEDRPTIGDGVYLEFGNILQVDTEIMEMSEDSITILGDEKLFKVLESLNEIESRPVRKITENAQTVRDALIKGFNTKQFSGDRSAAVHIMDIKPDGTIVVDRRESIQDVRYMLMKGGLPGVKVVAAVEKWNQPTPPEQKPSIVQQVLKAIGIGESVTEGEVVSLQDNHQTLKRLAKMWWHGDEGKHAQAVKMLGNMGWDIAEDDDDIVLNKDGKEIRFFMDDLYESIVAEAEYHGRKVQLNKPHRGDVKKFAVFVKDPKTGNVKKVNFGDPNMRIKKSNPKRRKSFRARHHCENPGPRTKARYWSCRKW